MANVYMGKNSVAGIPIENNDVNEDWELLLNMYATAYDATNDVMLTHTPGEYDPTTVQEVRGRFLILRKLCKKYAPELEDEIASIEKWTLQNIKGQLSDKEFLRRLKRLMLKNGIPLSAIQEVETRIDMAESFGSIQAPEFNMPNLVPTSKEKRKKQKQKNPDLFSGDLFKIDTPIFEIPKEKRKYKIQKTKNNQGLFDFGFGNFNFDLGFDFGLTPSHTPKKRRKRGGK